MFKAALSIILLYPLLWVVDKSTDSSTLMNYHVFVMNWWPVGVSLFITWGLLKKIPSFRVNEMENMRLRQYSYEIRRYNETPFVAPIMLMYLKNPPEAISPTTYDYINNTFYRTVIHGFRDSVYRISDFSSFEPAPRSSYLEVVGVKFWFRLYSYFILGFGWFAYWLLRDATTLISSWQLFTIPLVVYLLAKVTVFLQVITTYLPRELDNRIELENGPNLKVTWREVFPDQSFGITIIRAYISEKERRMRYESSLTGMIIPDNVDQYVNNNFPPYPFPSKELPEWTRDVELFYESKKEELQEQPKGNVIPMRRRTQH